MEQLLLSVSPARQRASIYQKEVTALKEKLQRKGEVLSEVTDEMVRLHSAIGFVTPLDRLENHHIEIFAERDKKLESARQTRKLKRENTSEK